ncbi:MAG: monofunctional biosynthetic peptidoglycan transglycosylase [Candidatus Methylacidiphilales bacterium]
MNNNKHIKALKGKLIKLKNWLLKVFLLTWQYSLMLIMLYRVLPVPITPLHVVRLVEQIAGSDEVRLNKSWRGIDYIGNNMIKATIVGEDLQFFDHYGFDFEQIYKALESNISGGKKLRGASTISQQTAKNLFFTPSRSWVRKGLEFYVTVAIELLWTKRRILEVYLNIIEMGKGIYGAEAAANFYYEKSANEMSKQEAASVVACFPNPRRWTANKPSKYIARKQSVIVRYMKYVKIPWQQKTAAK